MNRNFDKSDRIDNSDRLVADRVKKIIEAGKYTQEALARELSISQPHVSRLLMGKTAWRRKHLQRIAELYDISLSCLLLDYQEIPIVALLNDDDGFEYTAVETPSVWVGEASIPPGVYDIKQLYCIQINSDFFQPVLNKGTLLYVRKDSNEIHENMLAIFLDENGQGLLRQLKYSNDSIILKSLSPSGKYIIRPKSYLRLIDKVEWIKI